MTDRAASPDAASAATVRAGAAARATPPAGALPTVDRRNYAVERELARGGMGRIVMARDRRLDRPVAVKEVLAADPESIARFEREVRLTARLQHPGIVSIYEAGRWETGEPFFAMRLVDGRPLNEKLAEAKTIRARLALLPILLAVAEAIAYAHGQRIIHRDLKPHNVLVGTYGETVVIDWGLAKDLDDAAHDSLVGAAAAGAARAAATAAAAESAPAITVFGSVMGTPAYMPVEQATGRPLDERADVYAIGAMLYQLLSGRPPYLGANADVVLDALVAGPPPPLARVAPDAPADVVAIVERAMARDLAARYPSARQLADELRSYLTGRLVASHAYSIGELVRRWLRRHRGAAIVGAVAVVAVVAVAIASYARVVAEKARADDERDTARRALADAQRAQAAMLVDRARQAIVGGAPARAAPLLAAALELDGERADGVVAALEGQVRAALPAPAWTRRLDDPGALAVDAGGGLVARAAAAPLAARAGAPAGASVAADAAGRFVAIASTARLALWDVAAARERATVTGCGSDDDAALDVDSVTATGTVAGVCRANDNGASRLAVWVPGAVPGAALVLGDVALGRLHGAVASDDGRVAAAIEDGVDAPRVTRDGAAVTIAALPGATAVAIDPAGRLVAAGTASGHVQVWDVATGGELAVMSAGEPVVAIAFAPDGGLVVAAGKRGDAVAWPTAGLLRPQPIADAGAGSAAGAIVALRIGEHGARWAVATPREVAVVDARGRVGALAAPAGAVFDAGAALGGAPGAVAAIAHRGTGDAVTASVVVAGAPGMAAPIELPLRDPFPLGATWSDDDRYVFAGGEVFDVAAARAVGAQGSGAIWGCGTPRPDRAACFVDRDAGGDGRAATVALFRIPDGTSIETAVRVPAPATAFAFTDDTLIVGGCAGELAVLDVGSGATRPPVRLAEAACVTDLEASDTANLGAAALASRRVVIWELATGRVLGTIVLDRPVEAFALSADGALAIATGDGRVGVWDARTRAQLASARLGDAAVSGLRLGFIDANELVITSSHAAWRLPWTLPGDRAWRDRSVFVRDGLDVVLAPR